MSLGNALRTFIIQEELRESHAERFLTYVDHYHAEVILDLKKNLSEAWEKCITKLKRQFKPNPEAEQAAVLKNPKATLELSLSTSAEKLASPRTRELHEVSPSVKIPIIYSKEERDLICKNLMTVTKEAFEQTVNDWSEIFKYEKKGRAVPLFKILSDHDGVRLQLAVTSGTAEEYKTLYAVHVEFAKTSSKLRDFDRVYLTTLI